MKKTTSISIIRWTASIIGIFIVGFTLLFGIGYLVEGWNNPGPGLPTSTIITFVVWGIGLSGLILALWKPGIGGLFSLLILIVFNILVAVSPVPDSRYSPVLLIFLLPSILFLVYWWLNKSPNKISGK